MLGRDGRMREKPAMAWGWRRKTGKLCGRGRCAGRPPHLLKHASILLVDSQVHLQPALSQAEGQLSCPGRGGFGQTWQGRAMLSVEA